MKRLEICLTYRDKGGNFKSFDKVEGDTLVEVVAQFILLVAQVADAIKKEALLEQRQLQINDDDIPF